jgi:hypothetical protein
MNNSNRRKKLFKKGTGFSKYDSSGRVIYSESISSEGETIFHFYKYDDLGRRIEYKKCYYDIDDCEVMQMYTTYIENTIYMDDGSMIVMKCDWGMNDPYKHHYTEEHINPMGRKYCVKYLDTATGHCTIRRYNYDTRKYEVIFDGQELFVPYGWPLVYAIK